MSRSEQSVTLVAVHGNGGGGFRFARAAPHAPAGVRFEAVTLPGFGGRPAEPGVVTMADHAEVLWREIADLPRPLVLLGHGIGGSIALDLVQRHPVDGLIIHAPVGTRLERRWFPRLMRPRSVRRTIQWGISSRLTRPLVGRRFFSPEVPRDYVDRFLDEYARAESFSLMFDVITPEWWSTLRPAEVPSVLLWGEHDRVLGADQVDDYRQLLPRSAIDVVPGWGHFPMVDDPVRYAAVVGAWARNLVAGVPGELPRLGVGRLTPALGDGVGPKAAVLDRATAAGLPVPAAMVLPDGAVPPAAVPLAGRVAVRSAFAAEDGDVRSNAGRFTTVLDVDPHAADEVASAVDTVRASADDADDADGETGTARRDVLVMEMVDARVAGVAFTEPGWEDDLVEWVPGLADGLVGGRRRGESVALPRLRPGERPDRGSAAWQQRLALLLRDVRAELGDTGWDVEWADDGERCWLLQARPITVSPVRDEVFTIANHREILPDPPSVFMTSLVAAGSRELFEYYRRFDPSLPTDRPFIEVFDGRPLINLSLMTDLVRSLGLPTRLVTDSIGGADHVAVGVRSSRAVRRAPVLMRMGFAQLGALGYANRRLAELDALVERPAGDLAEAVRRARTAHVTTVDGMTALNTAASGPTAVLRRLGVLEEHAARQRTATSAMLADLDTMSHDEWLARHGHRGIYESDLSRPRYAEDPTPVLALRDARRTTPGEPPARTLRGLLTSPLWLAARRPMAARERFRADAMRSFLAIRRDLIRLAGAAGADEEDLWLLEIDEVVALDRGELPTADLLAQRRAEQAARRARPIPEVVRRFGRSEPVGDSGDGSADTGSVLAGVGLVARTVEGMAWVLDEPAHELPEGLDPATTVLVAPSVEPGWMATFGLVAGVAVEIGGDLSHGSILLRELGLPSVTNVAGLRRRVRTGDRIRIDGRRGTVELVDR